MFFLLIYTPFPAKTLQTELLELPWVCAGGMEKKSGPRGAEGQSRTEGLLRKAAVLGHICPNTPSLTAVLTAKTWGKLWASEHRDTSSEHPADASTLPSSHLIPARTFFPCICAATAEPMQAFSSQKMLLQGAPQIPCIQPH